MSRPEHSIDEAGWARFVAQHGVGDVLDGDVVKVVPFGAFVRLDGGVDGLAPKQLWSNLPDPETRVTVRIAAIDPDNRRVSLGPA